MFALLHRDEKQEMWLYGSILSPRLFTGSHVALFGWNVYIRSTNTFVKDSGTRKNNYIRFKFKDELELVLLRGVTHTEANLAEYGKCEALFEAVIDILFFW